MGRAPPHHAGLALLSLGALGIVFGDIGTSPLYALQTVFAADQHAVRPTQSGVYGVISLVFWAVTLIVSIKYVALIMRADNEGEGGIMALIALIREKGLQRRLAQVTLVALGIFGASLFYGDGMITPAISVLSAVEGIEVVEPSLHELVVPITLAILAVLFTIQRFGTGAVGRWFGPIMALWFTLLAVAGLHEVVKEPGILRAISPTYAVSFMFEHGHVAFIALGSVVLTVTGAEALYADMGHFGRPPIRLSWFSAVFPALILNYMGQGALILHNPEAIDNPFYLLIPHWGRIPMIGLATVATVIASQAVISGAFSVTRQAVQLGFLPRLTIRHTSREAGQVYVPAVNWGIFVAVVALVVGFGSSQHLAAAYGIAVTGTLAIDTVLFFVVVHIVWGKPKRVALPGAIAFLIIDLTFFSANLPKVAHGGWFPLAIAAIVFVVLTTWQRGREIITAKRTELEGPPREGEGAGGPAAGLGRGQPRPGPADLPLPAHGDLPRRQPGDDPARAARQRRAQLRPARQRGDRDGGDAERPARRRGRARVDRRPRLPRRRHHAPDRALRFPGRPRRPAHPAPRSRAAGARGRLRARLLLPLAHLDHPRERAGDGAVAQEALHRDRAQRGQPGALLPPAGRPHDRDGLARRALTRPVQDIHGLEPLPPGRTGGMEEQRTQLEDRPMAELVRQLSDQTTTLVRQEIELAKAEMTAKGKQVGIGAGRRAGRPLRRRRDHRLPHPRAEHRRRGLAGRADRRG